MTSKSQTTSANSMPVILIGQTTAVGKPVSELLRPEYEVVRFINTLDAAKKEIPIMLSGGSVAPEDDRVGTLDFSKRPAAVLIGGAFNEDTVKEVRSACGDSSNVPWLMRGPNAEERLPPLGPAYAPAVVESIKNVLANLIESGEIQKDGLHEW